MTFKHTPETEILINKILVLVNSSPCTVREISERLGITTYVVKYLLVKMRLSGLIQVRGKSSKAFLFGLPNKEFDFKADGLSRLGTKLLNLLRSKPATRRSLCNSLNSSVGQFQEILARVNEKEELILQECVSSSSGCGRPVVYVFLKEHQHMLANLSGPIKNTTAAGIGSQFVKVSSWKGPLTVSSPFNDMIAHLSR